MPKFTKPKIIKKADKIFSEDKRVVVEVTHLVYRMDDGKEYPKINLRTWNQDSEGFPTEKPKQLNLPVVLGDKIAQAILSLSR